MDFIVNGARAVSSFNMRSPVPLKIAVPPDDTTLAYNSLRISTSHPRNGNVQRQQTLVDGHSVRHAVSRASRNVQDSLARQVHAGRFERLSLRQALSVSLGVQRNFREQNGILFRRNLEFVVERVIQKILHVGPIRDDTELNGVRQLAAGRSCRGAAPAAIAAGGFSHGGRPSRVIAKVEQQRPTYFSKNI